MRAYTISEQEQKLLDLVAKSGLQPGDVVSRKEFSKLMQRSQIRISEYICSLRKKGQWPYRQVRDIQYKGNSQRLKPQLLSLNPVKGSDGPVDHQREARRLCRQIKRIERDLKAHAEWLENLLARDPCVTARFVKLTCNKPYISRANGHKVPTLTIREAWKKIEADLARTTVPQ